MIVRASHLLLPVALLLACSASAATPAKKKGPRAFLDVKTWYLDYEVDVLHQGPGMEMHSNTTQKVALDFSDLGPSITLDLQKAASMSTSDFVDAIGDSRYWMIKAPEGDDPADSQGWLDSLMAPQQLTYRFDSDVEHTHAQGIGRLMPGNGALPYQFEVDVAKKIYALKCPYQFLDVPATGVQVTGETRRWDGERWIVEPYKRDFGGHFPPLKSVTPPFGLGGIETILRGKLPDQVGVIAATDTFQFESYGSHGRVRIHYELSPTPPQPVELVFDTGPLYRGWRPTGGEDEQTRGPRPFMVEAKLQKPGGGDPPFKATRFEYRLLGTSRERGVCLNWPASPLVEPKLDMRFERDPAAHLNVPILILDDEGQKAAQTGEDMVDARISVSSFDWGGYAKIEIVATLSNGNEVVAKVPGTGEEALELPYRKPGSHVARAWAESKGVVDVRDGSDEEKEPAGDGFQGDGFTQYEEYRGFMEGEKWTDANPKKKDVFVLNLLRTWPLVRDGVALYRTATQLEVHDKLVETEVRLDKVINFNHSAEPHLVDQHVIYIHAGGGTEDGFEYSDVYQIGTPGTAQSVNINLDAALPSIVAHEMLHDSNVYHHGERDTKVRWRVAVDAQGIVHVYESPLGAQSIGATVASWTGLDEIDVRLENGYRIDPSTLAEGEKVVWLGQQQGQHSGDYDCLMRYSCVYAYPSLADPDVRYIARPERRGMGLCSDSDGTRYNDANHKPQSRFGNASVGITVLPRGDCKHQIRVNDMGEEPKR